MIVKCLVYIGLVFLTVGCEGIVGDTGYVYSSKTKEVLSHVRVTLYVNNRKVSTISTKSDGYFEANSFVGCVPKCPCATIMFSKSGFKPKIIKNVEAYNKKHPNNSKGYMNIFLEPTK